MVKILSFYRLIVMFVGTSKFNKVNVTVNVQKVDFQFFSRTRKTVRTKMAISLLALMAS